MLAYMMLPINQTSTRLSLSAAEPTRMDIGLEHKRHVRLVPRPSRDVKVNVLV